MGAGSIPKELGALSKLYMLLLNNNALTGETKPTLLGDDGAWEAYRGEAVEVFALFRRYMRWTTFI